ncbi:MAG: biotin--[acetyl-CoA-carboxylase] ligase [Halobacteriovoraceae bacterium]|nr:biotin--[acetyl-CoA-carboxylase] ligase [Halobacteriovoraceae bacterium]
MVEKVTLIHLEKVNSTNTYAKENYSHFDLSKITCITADEQTAGRGRFNRSWVSPKGENIYLTYFFTMDKKIMDLNNIAQILSLSVTKLLNKVGLSPHIKWPNDVLVNGKKIAGILCETIDLHDKFGVILGTGINVNMSKEALDEIDQPATSLLVEFGEKQELVPLINMLEGFFLEDYHLYKRDGFKPFYMSYDALLTHKGKPITLKQNGHLISGTLHSLNPDGRLNILLDNGEIQTLSSGEIKK